MDAILFSEEIFLNLTAGNTNSVPLAALLTDDSASEGVRDFSLMSLKTELRGDESMGGAGGGNALLALLAPLPWRRSFGDFLPASARSSQRRCAFSLRLRTGAFCRKHEYSKKKKYYSWSKSNVESEVERASLSKEVRQLEKIAIYCTPPIVHTLKYSLRLVSQEVPTSKHLEDPHTNMV